MLPNPNRRNKTTETTDHDDYVDVNRRAAPITRGQKLKTYTRNDVQSTPQNETTRFIRTNGCFQAKERRKPLKNTI